MKILHLSVADVHFRLYERIALLQAFSKRQAMKDLNASISEYHPFAHDSACWY